MIHTDKLQAVSDFRGEDPEDDALIKAMLNEARAFLQGFKWCLGIREEYIGIGVGGIVAVFLFRTAPGTPAEWIWVIVGDIPPAYIAASDDTPNPATALDSYLGAMEQWVDAVVRGENTERLIPVNVPPTRANAQDLSSRLRFIDENVLSQYKADLGGR